MKISKVIKSLETDDPRIRILNVLLLADNEVYTTSELKDITEIDTIRISTILKRIISTEEGLDRFRVGNKHYYGKKEAIKELKEGLIGKGKGSN